MGKRQDNLARLLNVAGFPVGSRSIPLPQRKDIESANLADQINNIYKKLGGILDDFPSNVGSWDITIGNVAIELDEERHFNRYRHATLQSDLYSRLPRFPLNAYRSHSQLMEEACLIAARHGGYWSNSSCVRQFGRAGAQGDLSKEGSPRWKQRAFYDFIKDLSPLIQGFQVARIAICDDVVMNRNKISINQILSSRLDAVEQIVALIEAQTGASLMLQ